MCDRSHKLLKIRPQFATTTLSKSMCVDERFQNQVLRPIIKMQNDLLLASFKNYIRKHKNNYYDLDFGKRLNYIENAVQRDIKFRNSLKGMILGQFTLEEYETYTTNSSALNKRMLNMVIERLKDQVQYFELQGAVAV